MELLLNILYQPVLACLFIWVKIQNTFSLVYETFQVKRAFNMSLLGDLVIWVISAGLVLALIYLAAKFVLENALPEVAGVKDYSAMLTGIAWRLGVLTVLYLILSALLYFFFNAGAMILKEMV
ncbi:MAG: hypothetical protein WC632_04365 [Candidatus Margulisiibacteriota bacterium]